jgi:hypothetical protein
MLIDLYGYTTRYVSDKFSTKVRMNAIERHDDSLEV